MGNLDENFILAIVVLIGALLSITRLIAIKTNHDPIMNRYKPGTPEYDTFRRFKSSPKFTIILSISVLVVPLAAVYIAYAVHMLIRANTPAALNMLILGPTMAVVVMASVSITMYYMFIKRN